MSNRVSVLERELQAENPNADQNQESINNSMVQKAPLSRESTRMDDSVDKVKPDSRQESRGRSRARSTEQAGTRPPSEDSTRSGKKKKKKRKSEKTNDFEPSGVPPQPSDITGHDVPRATVPRTEETVVPSLQRRETALNQILGSVIPSAGSSTRVITALKVSSI